ncbi:DUF6153 family protein [Antribacter sp. KLBMP9083]|uniref:DUF6153 family protein n=1 Tax=Antribacter soli TaxID=2910976 RepID=A0AA41UBI2_9MICO|nr:DUF6153 family protein [Antribacter soli]MCF4121124.1 DUF6153 family protein [Antribacter soli]
MLLITVVIAGVISMHTMSGSPSTHASRATAVTEQATDPAGCVQDVPDRTAGLPMHHHEDSCGCHGTTARCFMVVANLPTLATPPDSALNRLIAPLAQLNFSVEPRARPAREPSLHALGISRT